MHRLLARFVVFALACAAFALAAPAHATSAPTGLATTVADGQLILAWNAGAAGSTYNLYRATLGSAYTKITASPLTATTYTDPSLTNGQTYFYTVTAIVSGSESAQSPPVAGTPNVHVDSGGPALSSSGTNTTPYVWLEDDAAKQLATGGTVLAPSPAPTITNVPTGVPAALFQAQCVSADSVAGHGFSYARPVANGTYIVFLYFAEIGGATTGQRVFNVTANGASVVSNFDIYKTAGGADIAVAEHTTITVTNGTLTLQATNITGAAALAGFALTPPSPYASAPPPGWAQDSVPTEQLGGGGAGPSSGISVELPNGTPIVNDGADLSVYNPHGPGVSYERLYRENLDKSNISSAGLSAGWRDNYDMQVAQSGTAFTVNWINGGSDAWTANTNTPYVFTAGAAVPYMLVGQPSGTMNVWTSLTITFKDHTAYTFVPDASGTSTTFRLSKITNLAGDFVTINRASNHALTSLVNDASTPLTLLSFAYNGSSQLSTVTDAYGRRITYGFGSAAGGTALLHVSQVGLSSGATPADRWTYGYTTVPGQSTPYLNTVGCPDPSNVGGTATATIAPDQYGRAQQVQDATPVHDATHYGYGSVAVSVVKLPTPTSSTPIFSYQQLFDNPNAGQDTGFIDAANNTQKIGYTGSPGRYLPSSVTDRDNEPFPVSYYAFTGNNYADVTTASDPWGVATTTTYDFTYFPLGEATKMQETSTHGGSSALTPTTVSYYHAPVPSGGLQWMPQTVTTPAPNTVNGTAPTIDTTYTYDALGDVLTAVTPGPNSTVGTQSTYTTTTYAYGSTPSLGEPASVRVTGMNPAGYISLVTQAAQPAVSQTETYTYYSASSPNAGMVASETDASGYTTSYYYNVANQMVGMQYPTTSNKSGAYVADAYQYPGGPLASQTLYAEGVVTSAPTIPNGATVFEQATYTYDAEGNIATQRGSVYPVDTAYDALFRPVTTTEYTSLSGNAKEVTTYAYDAVGRLSDVYYPGWTMMTDPYDHWNYTYDPDGNLMQRVDGAGTATAYTLDPTLHSLVDAVTYTPKTGSKIAKLQPTTFGYDPFERRMAMDDDAGGKTYTYSDIDLPLTVATSFTGGPQNQQIAYAYNPDGTRSQTTPPLAPKVLLGGNPASVNNGVFTYAYDGLARLVQITAPFPDDSLYNNAPRTVEYAYEQGPTASSSGDSWLIGMEQGVLEGPFMLEGETQTPYDQLTAYAYNARGFLTELQNGEQGYPVSQFDADGNGDPMPYDAAGNRLGFVETLPGTAEYNGYSATRTVQYGYDALGRNQLASEASTITTQQGGVVPDANYRYAYAYDDAGNPTTWKAGAGEFGFDPDNQVTSVSGLTSPAYDGSGNPTTFSSPASTSAGAGATAFNGASFTFDAENRLRQIASPALTAQYDGDGMRAVKTASGTTTYFLYDGGQLLEEETYNAAANPATTVQNLYLYGADGLRARFNDDDNGQGNLYTYAYSYDPEGAVCQLQLTLNYDDSGYFAENTDCYDAWGQLLGSVRVPIGAAQAPFDAVGFGGQDGYYQDPETGLYELGARYYDAGKGRFVTRDPIGYQGGANLYGFCQNNPVMGKDPNGTDDDTSGWTYLSGVFDYATPEDYWNAAKNNSVFKAVFTLADVVSYIPDPANPAFDFKASQLAVEAGGQLVEHAGIFRTIQYSDSLPADVLGAADKYGNIFIKRGLTAKEYAETLRHELVHASLSPHEGGLINEVRANLRVYGYKNSQLLRYIEETWGESAATGSLKEGSKHALGYNMTAKGVWKEVGIYFGGVGTAAYGGNRLANR